MSRAQKIIRDISFESNFHDIYSPKFSSSASYQNEEFDRFEEEEAEGQICDERFSEQPDCSNSIDSDSELLYTQGQFLKKNTPIEKPKVLSRASSEKTEIERCPMELCGSENLEEEEIRETQALRQKERKVEAAHMVTQYNEETDVMETPQLSDISSFDPDDP